jgi:flavin reductase (DIM6/NTAB) family NADH-FMN oxidoreductase RutF
MQKSLRFKKARGNLCMPIILVTAKNDKIRNVMTAAWCTPSSFDPPLISIAIGTNRFTHDLIMKSQEFAINVVSADQMDLAIFCGNISGREVDKFKEKKISTRLAKQIKAPLINGCAANIECKVRHYYLTGDHTVFVGETVRYDEDASKVPLIRFRGFFYKPSESLGADEHKAQV